MINKLERILISVGVGSLGILTVLSLGGTFLDGLFGIFIIAGLYTYFIC